MPRARKSANAAPNNKHPLSIKEVEARNENQHLYLSSIEDNIVTVGHGPAGTGKTFLAVYQALRHHFKSTNKMKRIIITRPVVEAGESLGYLPGTLEDKIDPYLRPIYDSLYDLIGPATTKAKLEKDQIEIAPLAYMRGRTFKNAFVILDEAQNASLDQLKMILTRVGENCKLVINGDPFQTDLPRGKKNGLKELIHILDNIPDLAVCPFERHDIVRSKIVIDIVEAFEYYESAHNNPDAKR